jgi:hypothetical protein
LRHSNISCGIFQIWNTQFEPLQNTSSAPFASGASSNIILSTESKKRGLWTVSVLGRVAGIFILDTYLGSFREGKERKTVIQDIVAKVRGDVEIVSRVSGRCQQVYLTRLRFQSAQTESTMASEMVWMASPGDVTTC